MENQELKNVSGIVTTLNEEANIVACIRSLQQVCNEVVVVDSCSTDRTVELAEAAGARVYSQPYLGHVLLYAVAEVGL